MVLVVLHHQLCLDLLLLLRLSNGCHIYGPYVLLFASFASIPSLPQLICILLTAEPEENLRKRDEQGRCGGSNWELLLPIRMLIFVFAFFLFFILWSWLQTQMRKHNVIQLNCRIEFSSLLFSLSLSLSLSSA